VRHYILILTIHTYNLIDILILAGYYAKNSVRGPEMRKNIITTFILILFAFTSLHAQNNEANQAYIKAMTTPDAVSRNTEAKELNTKTTSMPSSAFSIIQVRQPKKP